MHRFRLSLSGPYLAMLSNDEGVHYCLTYCHTLEIVPSILQCAQHCTSGWELAFTFHFLQDLAVADLEAAHCQLGSGRLCSALSW